MLAHGIQVLCSLGRVVVWRLVQQDPANTKACLLVLCRPGCISVYLGTDFAQWTPAVVDPDIANGHNVCVSVELRYLPRVVFVGYGNISRPTVWVQDHKKVEVGVPRYPIFDKCELIGGMM